MKKELRELRKLFPSTPTRVRRDLKRALKLLERLPERSFERAEAREIISSLWKLLLAIEEGWVEEKEIEVKLPRKYRVR
jgi:sulfite reductase beta subunit-like hemoprotein